MGVLKNKLVEFGLSETDAEKFISENITNKLLPKSDLDAKIDETKDLTEQVKSLTATIAERDNQLEQLKTSATNAKEYQKQIEDLQAKNKDDKEKYEADMLQLSKDNQLSQILIREGAKDIELTKYAFSEFVANAKLDENGNIIGLSDKVSEIKSSERFSFCFDSTSTIDPLKDAGFQANQPGSGVDQSNPEIPVDPSKMTYEDYAKLYSNDNSPNVG